MQLNEPFILREARVVKTVVHFNDLDFVLLEIVFDIVDLPDILQLLIQNFASI